jgi:hypothetical protein
MNKKIVIALTVPMIVGMMCLGLVVASTPTYGIQAKTRLTKRVLEVSGDWTRIYIYVMNPKWQTVEIISIDIDWYVNGTHYGGPSTWYPPDWMGTEGEWDATVLPFEKSAILWFRWTYGPEPPWNEPSGLNTLKFTVYAIIDGQGIQLKTHVSFKTI